MNISVDKFDLVPTDENPFRGRYSSDFVDF